MLHEGQIDLNDLIKKEKTEAKKKQHMIHKQKKEKFKPKQHRNRVEKNVNRSGEKMFDDSKNRHHPGYAILVKGFISDVSVDDIFNLAQGRKVTSIRTSLRRGDGQPLDPKADIQMDVIITFPQKDEANSFINEYSQKMLDGKYSLTFTFVQPD